MQLSIELALAETNPRQQAAGNLDAPEREGEKGIGYFYFQCLPAKIANIEPNGMLFPPPKKKNESRKECVSLHLSGLYDVL